MRFMKSLVFFFVHITGSPAPPSVMSSKLFFCSWWAVCAVITSSYTGNLVAFMSVHRPVQPVDTLNKLVAHTDYNIGILPGGLVEHYIKVIGFTAIITWARR